jgi:hypothetical protein
MQRAIAPMGEPHLDLASCRPEPDNAASRAEALDVRVTLASELLDGGALDELK